MYQKWWRFDFIGLVVFNGLLKAFSANRIVCKICMLLVFDDVAYIVMTIRFRSGEEILFGELVYLHAWCLICFLSYSLIGYGRKLCKDLFKQWLGLDESSFTLEKVSGGITNLCTYLFPFLKPSCKIGLNWIILSRWRTWKYKVVWFLTLWCCYLYFEYQL